MDDIIFRKKALSDLREIREMLVAGGDPILASVLERAIKCVEQQPDANSWTPTEKGYPKKPGEYLCRCIPTPVMDDYPFYMVLKFYNHTEVPHFQFEVYKGIKVTDWMEIPRKEHPW